MVRAARGSHHCPILIRYRPTQTCFVNGSCRQTTFSLGGIDVGAPEEGSNGYTLGNKNHSQAGGTQAENIFFLLLFLFLPHLIIFEPLQSPIESLGAVLFPGPWDSPRSPQRFGVAISVSVPMMDYFSCLLFLSPAMHLSRHSHLANINVYVYIYRFLCIKNECRWRGGLSQHFAVPWHQPLSVNISTQPCQEFMWRWLRCTPEVTDLSFTL